MFVIVNLSIKLVLKWQHACHLECFQFGDSDAAFCLLGFSFLFGFILFVRTFQFIVFFASVKSPVIVMMRLFLLSLIFVNKLCFLCLPLCISEECSFPREVLRGE